MKDINANVFSFKGCQEKQLIAFIVHRRKHIKENCNFRDEPLPSKIVVFHITYANAYIITLDAKCEVHHFEVPNNMMFDNFEDKKIHMA